MAKYLTNNVARVICIGAIDLIPGTGPVEVPAAAVDHPIIAAKIKKGILTLTEDAKPKSTDVPILEMTVVQLKALAAQEKIDLGDAKTKTEIIAAIHAAAIGE